MLQVREMSKDTERMKKVLGGGAKSDRLYSALFDPNDGSYYRFENNLLLKGKIPTSFDRNIRAIMNVLRKWGYTLRLGGLTQWVKQPVVLINTAIQTSPEILKQAMTEVNSDVEGYKEFIKGETVSKRGEQKSLFNIGDSYVASLGRNLSAGVKQAFRRRITTRVVSTVVKGIDAAHDNPVTGMGALLNADRFAANPSYVAFYIKHLQSIGQEYKGFEEENKLRNTPERQEARAVAKQMLDDLQQVSNPAAMIAKMQSDRDYKTQVAKAILFPFGGFTTSTKQRLFSDWRAMFTGNSKQRKYAVKDITAAFAEQAVYQTINQFVIGELWHQLGEAYEWLFDLPDDDDEDRKKKLWQRTWTGMLFDAVPLMLTNPVESLVTDGINYGAYELYKWKNDEDISERDYAKEIGFPLAKYGKPDATHLDVILDALGPITAPIQTVIESSKNTAELSNEDIDPQQKKLIGLSVMMQWANFAGLWPSDLTGGTLREVREQKKMNKSSGGSPYPHPPTRPHARPRPARHLH